MNNVLLSIKTDSKTKQDLKSFASELGITSTAFVNMVIKQALRDRKIVLTSNFEPSPYLKKLLEQAEKDIKDNKNLSPTFDSVDDMFKHLEKTA
jgi:addiction module RelB/DinJ family antitoxin